MKPKNNLSNNIDVALRYANHAVVAAEEALARALLIKAQLKAAIEELHGEKKNDDGPEPPRAA